MIRKIIVLLHIFFFLKLEKYNHPNKLAEQVWSVDIIAAV
jgi:hypothetical protein